MIHYNVIVNRIVSLFRNDAIGYSMLIRANGLNRLLGNLSQYFRNPLIKMTLDIVLMVQNRQKQYPVLQHLLPQNIFLYYKRQNCKEQWVKRGNSNCDRSAMINQNLPNFQYRFQRGYQGYLQTSEIKCFVTIISRIRLRTIVGKHFILDAYGSSKCALGFWAHTLFFYQIKFFKVISYAHFSLILCLQMLSKIEYFVMVLQSKELMH